MPGASFIHMPPLGTCSYGSYTFSAAANTVAFSVTPVLDQAQRTVVFSRYRISIEDYINAPASDPVVQAAISQLTATAYPLLFSGRSLSPIAINQLGKVIRDAKWGPIPISCELTTYGPTTSKIVWTVEFCVATCDDANYTGPYEFNYKLAFDIDRAGYTKRTYSGHIKIAVTRLFPDSRLIPDNADAYRSRCVPPLLPGFRRVTQSYQLDEAKSTLQFTIVDEEIAGNYPPQGILECSANHTYATTGNWVRWMGTLAAEYEVVRGNSIDRTVIAFRALLNQRIAQAAKMRKIGPDGKASGNPVQPIPWSYEVEDVSIYGKLKARFRCSYTFAGISLDEILKNGGLWMPVIDPSTDKEASPVAFNEFVKVVNGPRGYAQLGFRPGDDALVDLCGTVPTIITYTPPATGAPTTYPLPGYPLPGSSGYPGSNQQDQFQDVFPQPTQQGSWLMYECDVAITLDSGVVVGTTLPQSPIAPPVATQDTWDVMTGITNGAVQSSPFTPLASQLKDPNGNNGSAFTQQRKQPVLYLTLFGRALRAGFGIPVPSLTQVNGQVPTLISDRVNGDFFRTAVVKNCGVAVVAAEWKFTYVLTDPGNAQIDPLPNSSLA